MRTPEELVAAVNSYREGDRESFDRIYSLSYSYFYTCISHMVKDKEAAMDMMQETYLEISRSIHQLRDTRNFLSWGAVIANRKCLEYLDKAGRIVLSGKEENNDWQAFSEGIADDEAFIPETILQDREKVRLIREIIDGLSDMQRLCVIYFYFNEMKQEEIAEELGIPVNTVKSHLSRAKAKIKEGVLELERKEGTKLYAMAPFMLLFFAKETEQCQFMPMPDRLISLLKEVEIPEDKAPAGGIAGKIGGLARTSVKAKVIIGILLAVGAVAVAGIVFFSSADGRKEAEAENLEEINGDAGMEAGGSREDQDILENDKTIGDGEALQEENDPTEETDLEEEEDNALAISGQYDQLGRGRNGVIAVCNDGKWGLVTYDNQVLVPLGFEYASQAPNDDGQTFFGNEGDYRVYDREGNEIFKTDKTITAVSEGVVLWQETDWDEGTYEFGYVKLDGTVLFESTGDEYPEQAGAVGFSEGYAICSTEITEWRISGDGTAMDIYGKRYDLRHPGMGEWEDEMEDRRLAGELDFDWSGTSVDVNFYYPIGACCNGYYLDRGMGFEDMYDVLYVYDINGMEQYPLRISNLAEHKGFAWDDDLYWRIQRFIYNGNYCYNNGTLMVISLADADKEEYYLIDFAKQERETIEWQEDILSIGDQTILAEGEYIEISDEKYWLIEKEGKWGYIDHTGQIVEMFDDAARFYNGKSMVIRDGYAYFIDSDRKPGEWKIPAKAVECHDEVFVVDTPEGQKCYTAEQAG